MHTNHSITRLLPGVKNADEEACCVFFGRCYERVVNVCRKRLQGTTTPGFDADDVAISTMYKFLRRAAEGNFKRLENREDVWRILTLLVGDNISNRLRHERAKKRGGGAPHVSIDECQQAVFALDDAAFEVVVDDAQAVFLAGLDSEVRAVVKLIAEGHTHVQIAKTLGISVRTVARRLDGAITKAYRRILDINPPDD